MLSEPVKRCSSNDRTMNISRLHRNSDIHRPAAVRFIRNGMSVFVQTQTQESAVGPEIVIRLGAAAGVLAFFVSSLASSFSFRAIQNGIVFFAFLALIVTPYRISKSRKAYRKQPKIPDSRFYCFRFSRSWRFRCRPYPVFYITEAEKTKDPNQAVLIYQTPSFGFRKRGNRYFRWVFDIWKKRTTRKQQLFSKCN